MVLRFGEASPPPPRFYQSLRLPAASVLLLWAAAEPDRDASLYLQRGVVQAGGAVSDHHERCPGLQGRGGEQAKG